MSSPFRPSSKSNIIGAVRSILTELPFVDPETGFSSFPAESEKVIENGRKIYLLLKKIYELIINHSKFLNL